jgi:hypothetical protein
MNNDFEKILAELAHIKQHMPNGELKRIEKTINELKADMSEMKKTLLDPNNGVIVQTNKNTEWREERQKKIDLYDQKVTELDNLIEWKGTVTRVLWGGFTALLGLIAKVVADSFK